MSAVVTIGGEEHRIADFSAFKAIYAMSEVSAIQNVWRDVLTAGAEFKRQYEAEHYVEIDRAEARRQFPPRVLLEDVPISTETGMLVEDGVPLLRQVPMIRDGQPIMGPDPLGHLTDEDWQASGQKLRIADSPEPMLEIAAMVEAGFRMARTQVLRLIALAIAKNSDLEAWENEGGDAAIAAQLDAAAQSLMHRASMAEIVRLAIATAEAMRDELAVPFGEAREAMARLRPTPEPDEQTPEPMRVETPPSGEPTSSPTSSTDSPADTADGPPTSSTAPAGESSPVSATG